MITNCLKIGNIYILEDAMGGLIEKPSLPPVNKDDLINKKDEADKLNPGYYEDFTDVENAINEADKVIKDDNATQKEVDDAKKNLEDAIDNLIKDTRLERIDNLIIQGYVPIANREELNKIKISGQSTFGQGTNNQRVEINKVDYLLYSIKRKYFH